MPESVEFWNWVVTDGLTLLAVIVALFLGVLGPKLAAQLNPPKLKLSAFNKHGSLANTESAKGPTRTYFHLSLENLARTANARDVQVCLLDIMIRLDDGDWFNGYAGPIPLKWRHNLGGGSGAEPRTIGAPCDIDLFNHNRHDFVLAVQPAPYSLPALLASPAGVFAAGVRAKFNEKMQLRLFVQARGTEADSDVLEVEVVWDWSEIDPVEDPTPPVKIGKTTGHKTMPKEVLDSRANCKPTAPDGEGRFYWGGQETPDAVE